MRLSARYDYSAPVEAVADLLAERGFQLQAAEAAGAVASEVEVVGGPAGEFTVTSRGASPVDHLPQRVRAFLPAALEIRQAQVWSGPAADGHRRATLAGEIVGAPVQVTGLLDLAPNGAGSRLSFAGEVKAQLPLVGPAIEQAAVPAVSRYLEAQHEVAERWLAEAA
ncbi:MAG: DUF2505 domain-containing protein [Bifidobacteriaceae bacterium]|jgi:hypothetical protein|nr:DUF2505 domain-containing protein [Bifidobacteriaceae bacterium]